MTGIHWNPLDSDWTHSPVDWDWTQESGWESSGTPVGVQWTGLDWTGLQWTGHSASQSGLVRGPLESTGIHWSPLESIWITWGRVKTSNHVITVLQHMDLELKLFEVVNAEYKTVADLLKDYEEIEAFLA
ncbi:uncharacterized protein LACBIDRAFT_328210 [Laccaria bicolor S238N-H82]|uniref:Predicted protein n=1 Tax=Laccaria bicolor (strain S238N-H82 / ATCC MYA-4686) TaxID=486041 RepID=B0DE33_LACBS|nr:uncharacterized protein LACBIDRAFT_328210 [Laccaria bicolor S238N-H82]EDR07318.1 predicted protein [Laccaria bicolor S238N-H82]|eukprot:XP_001882249.1 predicted protein [Laccaria bicolor S238N-H82]